SLMQPVLLDRLIGYRGFKSLAFVSASSDTIYAIDDDLARVYWKTHFNTPATPEQGASLLCPGGLTVAATRPVSLAPLSPGRGGGGNRISSARSMVGGPDQGFPDISGRGSTAPVSSAPPPPAPAGPAGPPPAGGGGGGGQIVVNSVYVLASDGMVHQLSVQTGKDVVMQPSRFLPPNANASSLLLVDNTL